jgi:hypothetical protein
LEQHITSSSGLKSTQSKKPAEAGSFLLGLLFNLEVTCSSETSIDFNRLHGIIYQKTELFILCHVAFEVLTTVTMMSTVLSVVVHEEATILEGYITSTFRVKE